MRKACPPSGGNMLYLVRMDVHLPHDMPAALADEIKAREKAYSQ